MRSRWLPVLGWVECAIGLVFLLVSAVGFFHDGQGPYVLLWDAVTFVLLLVMVRAPLPGFALLIVAAFVGLLVDPEGIGISHYIAACGVVLAVRLGRMPLAVVGTATLGGALFYTMLGRTDGTPLLAVAGTVLFYSLVWALGLGMRSASSAEAARVEARHRKRQMEVATDLHDFVSGNLAAVVMAAEALPQDNPAVVELAERVRRANASLRAITSVLREEDGTEERIPAVGAEEALARGLETVGSRGGQPQVAPGTKTALVGLPKAVDHAVGRILSEALCNVAKYADLEEPVVVAAERTGDRLDLMVSNGIDGRRTPSPDGMGLLVVRQHAEVVGGRADSSAQGKVWVCTASLPLGHTGAAR